MGWLQLRFNVTEAEAELLSEWLQDMGAVAVTFQDAADQPLFEPPVGTTPLWSNIQATGLFEDNIESEQLIALLQQQWPFDHPFSYQLEKLAEQNWERSWMDNFKPMRFGDRLWICPSWANVEDKSAIVVDLDPGLAFGTGTHATTGMCLEWLDQNPPHEMTIIDYGCGSGILGIAALKLGAKQVFAIDNDPQALEATRENANRNQLSETQVICSLPQEIPASLQADTLLANILANPLIELATHLSQLVVPKGHLVLSGILEHQAEAVKNAYAEWFDLSIKVSDDGWVRLAGIKRTRDIDVRKLKGLFPKPKKAITIKQKKQAIAKRGSNQDT